MKYTELAKELEASGHTATQDGWIIERAHVAGLLMAAAHAVRELDGQLESYIRRVVRPGELDDDGNIVTKRPKAAKPEKAAAGGERKRAARGLPPCEKGGRHTWNLQGWCSKCGNVHRDGKVQTEVPGASAPPAAGAAVGE